MGHTQAKALERAFGVFYRLGLTLSFFLRNGGSFNAGGEIRQGLGQAYADLVMLVVDVTSFYRSKSKGTSVLTDLQANELTVLCRHVGSVHRCRFRLSFRPNG